MLPKIFPLHAFGWTAAAAILLTAPGCQHHQTDELAKAVYEGEKPVAMRGSDTFFDGKVAVIVTISRGIGRGYVAAGRHQGNRPAAPTGQLGSEGPPESSDDHGLSSLPGSVGGVSPNVAQNGGGPGQNGMYPSSQNPQMPGSSSPMPGQLGQGGMGGGMPGGGGVNPVMNGGLPQAEQDMGPTEMDEDAARMEQEAAIAYLRAKAAIGSPLPPVTLRLGLRNLTSQVTSVQVDTFNSDLGNFAVEPGTLNLMPHELSSPTPMISQLGVTSDIIPVKVTLRLNGQTETKTIMVHSLIDPDTAP